MVRRNNPSRVITMIKTMLQFEQSIMFMEHQAQYYLDSEKVNGALKGKWHVTQKEDGVYGNIVCIREPDKALNTVKVFSRDGKQLSNTQWTERQFAFVPPGVYIAEFTIFNGVFEDASRFYNPNVVNQLDLEPGQFSNCHLFDHVTIEEFIKGKTTRDATSRYAFLYSIFFEDTGLRNSINVNIVTKYTADSYQEALFMADHLITKGAEGAVLLHESQTWARGKRLDSGIKVVAYKYFDLRILGVKAGKGKHAKVAGALYVLWRAFADKENPPAKLAVDGKIDYDTRREWYVAQIMAGKLEGKIAKVKCKGLTKYGMMRQPKLIEVRWDKTEADM